jgi:hypothetical protein
MVGELISFVLLLLHLWRKRRKIRQFWVRPIYQRQLQQSTYHNLLQELPSDCESHFKFLLMSKEAFDELVDKVRPLI